MIHLINYRETEEYITKNLIIDENKKNNLGMVFTPSCMIKDCLNNIPKEIWGNPNLKWLDLCAGIGNFSIHIIQYLNDSLNKIIPDLTQRINHILTNMLYLIEIDNENCKKIKDFFGININLIEKDFLNYDFKNSKFDVIVGNPPYNLGGNRNKGIKNIYAQFAVKSLNILNTNGILGLLHPPGYRNGPHRLQGINIDLNAIYTRKQIIYIRVYHPSEVRKKMGNIMINIDCIILKNSSNTLQNNTKLNNIKYGSEEFIIYPECIILNHHNDLLSFLNDINIKCGNIDLSRSSSVHASTSEIGNFQNVHTITKKQIRFFGSKKKHPYQDTPKIIINGIGVNYIYDDQEGRYGGTQNTVFVFNPTMNNKSILKSYLFQLICSASKITGNNLNIKLSKFVPQLSLEEINKKIEKKFGIEYLQNIKMKFKIKNLDN